MRLCWFARLSNVLLTGLPVLVLQGCMLLPAPPFPETRSERIALSDTPFFPQARYQCGPAALAMVLQPTGVDVHPSDLVDRIYLPDRRGSLQPELVAATRAHGRIPYRIDAGLEALLAEIDAGRPVLVLQNLGVSWLPRWHYAVAIGYDRAAGTLILRSGTTRRRHEPLSDFMRTWNRSERWGLVVLRPGDLPVTPDPDRLLEAIADVEAQGELDAAARAYAAMLHRWPEHAGAVFGLANVDREQGRLDAAERGYRRFVDQAGPHPAALNNLALVLMQRGCFDAALACVERARAGLASGDSARGAIDDTAARIRAARREAPALEHCPAACSEQ